MNPQSVLTPPTEQLEERSSPVVRRYFPGWTMLAVAGTAQYMSAPGQSYSIAAFKDPMRAGLGLSETDYSLAYGCATLVSACLLPFVGRAVDRFGARIMLPLIAAGLGCGCFMVSQVESLAGLYISFSIVRSLGQGALSLVSVWLVGEWFERKRGMATALAGLGGGLSVMTIPLINNYLIETYGWQTAWVGLAVAVWGILILPAIFFIRNRPEDLGLHPDGIDPDDISASESADEPESESARGPVITAIEDSWTAREALRDTTFWKLLSVPATSGLVGTALIYHQVALLGSHGIPRSWALGLMTVQAGFATLMTFPAGWATDRFASRYLLCGAMLALTSALVLVMTMPAIWMAGVYAVLLGLHGCIMRSTAMVVWINYYGRAHQGAVRGVAFAVMIFASALGPSLLAVSVDSYGSYLPGLCVCLLLPISAAIAVWTARPPRHPASNA